MYAANHDKPRIFSLHNVSSGTCGSFSHDLIGYYFQLKIFRYINKAHYEPLWNKDHIERVDIVMKEKDDAVGKFIFHNVRYAHYSSKND